MLVKPPSLCRGLARQGNAWLGKATQGQKRLTLVRGPKSGTARLGKARQGQAWQDEGGTFGPRKGPHVTKRVLAGPGWSRLVRAWQHRSW